MGLIFSNMYQSHNHDIHGCRIENELKFELKSSVVGLTRSLGDNSNIGEPEKRLKCIFGQ